jgi:riboflavin synthase
MFTGLVEDVGVVTAADAGPAGCRLLVRTRLAPELRLGDSLSVDGVCLTVVAIEGDEMAADIGPETARITTLGSVAVGARVNLERAARADSRLGGHLVQGHVDGMTTVVALDVEGDAHWMGIALPAGLAHLVVAKGSVAVSGVSLTVARVAPRRLDVMLIPYTWAHTNLSSLAIGGRVNLECDMVGKYVARAVEGFKDTWRNRE